MILFKHFFMLIICTLFWACTATTKTTTVRDFPPLDYNEPVVIIVKSEYLPMNADYIGEIKVGDSGFSVSCSLEYVLEKAKIEARKSGGNIVLITDHKTPDLWSSCHRISGKIYIAANLDGVKQYKLKKS